MARLGPWDAARRVAVAVSGGPDSMALVLLAAGWGDPAAFIVDHGLRPGSAREAEQTRAVLAARGIPVRVLTLSHLRRGAGMPARARAARYQALEAATAQAGLVDLLLGHHAGDQAETILMRTRRSSGPRGLAGMAALSEGILVRRLRPLLAVPPERLRATVRSAGLNWVEDPTNQDLAFTRSRMRAEIRGVLDAHLATAHHHGTARRGADQKIARVLGERAAIYPEGYAVLTPGPIESDALALLLQAIAGAPFAPPPAAVAALALAPHAATLGGVRIMPAGRLGPGWLLVREAAAMAPGIRLEPGAVWDGRVRAGDGPAHPNETLGALGAEAAEIRQCGLPSAVLQTLPAVRRGGVLSAVALPAYIGVYGEMPEIILHHAVSPACGAPFMA